jgi:fibronectin type 3 domain-containing protein
LTLNPGQTATLSIEFDPTAAGAVSGSLTLTSNSCTGSSAVITLTGTGEAASTSYEVNLTWDAPSSSSDPVAGYNVYRSPSGATSYQMLNTSAITQTSYVDTSAQAGQTYDYIVESVDASGVTSTPSNMASATIP